jgi:catechol 2,3-dioxygenase-like lactoylglutathione lyase family enzyme
MVTRLSTIVLRVANLGGAVEFYRDTLGLPVTSVGPAFAFFELGGTELALNRRDGGDPAAAASTTEVVLEVDDPVETFRRWREAGVPFAVELRAVMEQEGRRLMAAHFRDPDGHLVSLTGWE